MNIYFRQVVGCDVIFQINNLSEDIESNRHVLVATVVRADSSIADMFERTYPADMSHKEVVDNMTSIVRNHLGG